mmetsp:Transcript_393/g.483  ORF Transcript_393/g.483 Transcript_393/m.483 type:complete len:194 (-) Transcript_393:1802-2383(-)
MAEWSNNTYYKRSAGRPSSSRQAKSASSPKQSITKVAKTYARQATTGTKMKPTVTKVYHNSWGDCAVYSNGGTVSKNRSTGQVIVRTPQARSNPRKYAANYVTRDKTNGRYVGMTSKISGNKASDVLNGSRVRSHFEGKGSAVTRARPPVDVPVVVVHGSVAQAKKGETKLYYQQKGMYGADKVRGAGHTKRF